MKLTGSYDIINTMIRYNAIQVSTDSPQTDQLFKGAMAARYTNAINDILSNEVNTFMESINTKFENVQDTLTSLFDEEEAPYEAITETETTNVATVFQAPETDTFELDVNQLAQAQENTSDTVNAEDTVTLEQGTETLTLNRGEETFNIDVNVRSYDTNRSLFTALADAINNAKAGVTAQVTEDSEGGIALQVAANETGASNAFAFEGNLADTYGLNQVTQASQNAQYEIDGASFESETNTVSFANDTIQLQLNETTDEPLTFEVRVDEAFTADEVNRFVDTYNDLKTFLNDHGNNRQVNLVNRQLTNLTNQFQTELAAIGVDVNRDEILEVNEKRLQDAIEKDVEMVQNTFKGTASFGDRFARRVDTIAELPSRLFAQEEVIANRPETANAAAPFSYLSSAQSVSMAQIQNRGNLIDIMF